MTTLPEFPSVVVPVPMFILPLLPVELPAPVAIRMSPLAVSEPDPDTSERSPPWEAPDDDDPEDRDIVAPGPVSPLPAEIVMAPAAPPTAGANDPSTPSHATATCPPRRAAPRARGHALDAPGRSALSRNRLHLQPQEMVARRAWHLRVSGLLTVRRQRSTRDSGATLTACEPLGRFA